VKAIVVGAGPGGATAARLLAKAGADVRIFEKSTWPREKTCGDGISPLGVRELARSGLAISGLVHLGSALVSTPRGTAFRGGWPAETPWGTTIARREFDAQLVGAAVVAGAAFEHSTPVTKIVVYDDAASVTVRSGETEHTLEADVVLIAEGATGGLASALDFPRYRSRLVAIRGYVESGNQLAPEYGLFYERGLSPGYGWIFPMDAQLANVGICIDERALKRGGGNLRALLTRWIEGSPFVRDLLGSRANIEGVRGGIIPTGRKIRSAPRVFLLGDAAGVADPFTAEGIYEAIHSAVLAADALTSGDFGDAYRRYERSLAVFDRNERTARAMRATFGLAIEPYARRAARDPAFAGRLNTDVFFLKPSFTGFVRDLMRA
jgi:geranylgeranyl reductase family protein